MYKTVKTQTNLPVKICHLKVVINTCTGVIRKFYDYNYAFETQRRLDTITCTADLAQLIDKDFQCKLLAGVARSLETEGKS